MVRRRTGPGGPDSGRWRSRSRTLAAARRKRTAAERPARRRHGGAGSRSAAAGCRPRLEGRRRGRARGARSPTLRAELRARGPPRAGCPRRRRVGSRCRCRRAAMPTRAAGRSRRVAAGRRAARGARRGDVPALSRWSPTRSDAGHDAAGETIYFGVVPTGSSDLDHGRDARFDERRLRDPLLRAPPPRRVPARRRPLPLPSPGAEPTEPYRLAAHFDLVGTRNRPVTVQLPDLTQLQADAAAARAAATGGVHSVTRRSELGVHHGRRRGHAGAPDQRRRQICSFAIPLITIVALFVLDCSCRSSCSSSSCGSC